ncbi:MAG: SRPBCC family protein [Polyangiaceae bacterium]|nr:SRPBCC family protein [Polyangiaceae bacterium]
MNEIVVSRDLSHDPARVWARYTDHEGWSSWAGLGRVRLVRRGAPERDGEGAVRAFSLSPGLREEVVTFERERLMQYRVTRGPLPIDRHLGEVLFEPRGGGVGITWRVSFRALAPGLGGVMERGLSALFARVLGALDRDLARR